MGAAFLIAGLTRSTGAVVVDTSLPVIDVEAKINAGLIAAGYTFGLFGKLTLVTATIPYSWGDIAGTVGEEARAVTRSGLADSRLKLSINLAGNPAMGARAFVKARRQTIVGASPTVTAPSGRVRQHKVDQSRDESVVVQARGGCGGAGGALGLRRGPGRLAVRGEQRLLSR